MACSTKDRGIRATSSSRTPAKVQPWMRAALDSSRPPNRRKRFSCPPNQTVTQFSLCFSLHRKPMARSRGSRSCKRFRRSAPMVLPHRANCFW